MLVKTFKLASKSPNFSVYLIYNCSLRGGRMMCKAIFGQLFSEHNIELGSLNKDQVLTIHRLLTLYPIHMQILYILW